MLDWFDIDKEGLARLLERKGKAFAVLELIQNCWDEDVTSVIVTLTPAGRGKATITVTDDNPEGFKFIEHAYTLFADSTKKGDPEKRGRFNLGEKLFLAVCDDATIWTTKGLVTFDKSGRSLDKKDRRETGTKIMATIRLNADEQKEVAKLVQTLLPPANVTTTFNDALIHPRIADRSFSATLPTEIADPDNILRPSRRKTIVGVYSPEGVETPHIYEMGIPICEHDGKYHVNVMQKVPLNFNRDNVTPAYLRQLREVVLDNTFDLLTQEEAHKPWVAEALPNASEEALQKVITERFGENAVIFDPSCPEANKRAVEQGRGVIYGRQLPSEVFSRMKGLGMVKPAGQYLDLRGDHQTSPDGLPPIAAKDYTPGMDRVTRYAHSLAEELLGRGISTAIFRMPVGERWQASFGGNRLSLNLTVLGHKFFDNGNQQQVDELLIHEFSHAKVSDHLSNAFSDECCRLGAKIRTCKTVL